jgi:hypothetical protein
MLSCSHSVSYTDYCDVLLLFAFLTAQLSAGKHSPILGFNNQQEYARWPYLQFRKFLTTEHVPRITDFCICMYVFGCKLSLFRLCDSDFGITAVDGITIGINCAVFCFHIAFISFSIIIIIIIIIMIIISMF